MAMFDVSLLASFHGSPNVLRCDVNDDQYFKILCFHLTNIYGYNSIAAQ